MDLLLYRFDDPAAFPLLETETTARGPVALSVEGHDVAACLRIQLQRQEEDHDEIRAVIGLPMVAVGGQPKDWLLDVMGDHSGALLELEAADRRGWGFSYSFGRVDFSRQHTCRAPVQEPTEYWSQRKSDGTQGVVPPIQPFRLVVVLDKQCQGVDVALVALRVDGDVQIVPPGLAQDPIS